MKTNSGSSVTKPKLTERPPLPERLLIIADYLDSLAIDPDLGSHPLPEPQVIAEWIYDVRWAAEAIRKSDAA